MSTPQRSEAESTPVHELERELAQLRTEHNRTSIRLQALVTALGQVVYEWRPGTNEVIWDGDFTNLLGYSREEIGNTTESWTGRVHPDEVATVHAEVEKALHQRRVYDLEYRFRHRDGSYRWMHDRGVLFAAPDGTLERIIGVFTDVTERHRAEMAVRESEDKFVRLFRANPDAVSLTTLDDGIIIEANDSYCRLFRHSRDELIGRSVKELKLWHDLADRERFSQELLAAGRVTGFETRYRNRDGEIRDVSLSAELYELGGRRLIVGIHRDITDQKRADAALRSSEARLAAAQEQAKLGSWELDAGASAGEWSRGMFRLFDRDPAKGAPSFTDFIEIIHPDDRANVLAVHERMFRQGGGAVVEFRRNPDCGPEKWFEVRIATQSDADGRTAKVLGTVQDITERKRVEEALRASEAQFSSAFHANVAGMCITTVKEGRFLEVNNALLAMIGYKREEVIGRTAQELGIWLSPEDRRKMVEALGKAGSIRNLELDFGRRDGSIGHSLRSVERLTVRGQECILTLALDVTENKRAQQSIAEERNLLRTIIDNLPGYIYVKDTLGRYIATNAPNVQFLGADREEDVYGKTVADFFAPEIARGFTADDQSVLTTGQPVADREEPYEIGDKRGWFATTKIPLHDTSGATTGLVGITMDITQRKRADARELAFSELGHKLSVVLTAREAGEIILDIADRLFGWDAGALDLYCAETDRLHGILNKDTVDGARVNCASTPGGWEPTPRARRIIESGAELILREPPYSIPSDSIAFGNTGRASASIMLAPVRDGEKVIGILSIQSYKPNAYSEQDLSTLRTLADYCGGALNRIQIREALGAAEEKYRSIFENSVAGIYQSTPEGRFVSVNPAVARILGYASPQELIQQRTDIGQQGYVDPVRRDEFKRQIEEHGFVTDFEYEARRKDGATVWLSENARVVRDAGGRVLYYEGSLQDITERKKLAEQLRQSQKMDAIGQLAGGIAHDFNNILTIIRGHADLLRVEGKLTPQVADSVGEIARAAERAANLTRQLVTFSRRQVAQPRKLNLNVIASHMTNMLQRLLGEDIKLNLQFAPGLHSVHADQGMMEQVLLNLAVNARDAMPRGGDLFIETAIVPPNDPDMRANPRAANKTHVRLTVRDTGCGIAPEVLPHIFEPFFTTKDVGKGTGLGLATVYGIVQQHSGWVTVESQPGHGATFHVFLPSAGDLKATTVADQKTASVLGGSETILLVEDEPGVRTLTRLVLQRHGYTVLEATDAIAALKIWEQHDGPIHLLFTDIVMPGGMSGRELASRLRASAPDLHVIFTSGYSPEIAGRELDLQPGQNFIQKPATPTEILAIIRQCLGATPSSP